jgi:putative Ca2+/H+ antiporter (TMEM165/GDT1 family)
VALILPAELPDKTMVTTLVLSTRYRPWPVWIGAAGAFVIQSAVAVVAGGLIARLPRTPVLAVSAALFAVGAIVIARTEFGDEPEVGDEAESEVAASPPVHSSRRIAGVSFAMLFAAEWGDLSQLLTAGLAARYDDPLSVFIGATGALFAIAGLAVVVGRGLLRVLPVHVLRRGAAGLFGLLAVVTAIQAAGVHLY